MRYRLFPLAALCLVVFACGGGIDESLPDDALVIVVSSDLAIGPHRVAVGALSDTNESLVADTPVSFEFFRPDGTPAGAVPARFMWAIPDIRGLWVSEFHIRRSWRLDAWSPHGRRPIGEKRSVFCFIANYNHRRRRRCSGIAE